MDRKSSNLIKKLSRVLLPPKQKMSSDLLLAYNVMPEVMEYSIRLKSEEGKGFLSILNKIPVFAKMQGKTLLYKPISMKFSIYNLAMWFVWCSDQYGLERAIEALITFAEIQKVKVTHCLWLLGLKIREEISLQNGYRILPIESMPWSYMRSKFSKFPGIFPLFGTPISKCAITFEKSVPIFPSLKETKDLETMSEDVYKKMKDIARVISSLSNTYCIPYMAETYVNPMSPFGPFAGSQGGGIFIVSDIRVIRNSVLEKDKAAELDGLMGGMVSRSESDLAKIRMALDRFAIAKTRNYPADKVLDLGISLETILLSGKEKDQLRQMFSLRGSWLIGRSGEERLSVYQLLKQLYNLRSEAVHNGKLSKKSEEKARQHYSQFLDVTEKIFQKVILGGFPNWDKLILNVTGETE